MTKLYLANDISRPSKIAKFKITQLS